MKKFIVKIPQIHISHREVEAIDEEEALEIANEHDEFYLEYRYTLGQEEWEIGEKRNANLFSNDNQGKTI